MNDSVRKMLEYNRIFVDHEMYQRYETTKYPDRKIAILSCMDTRMTELLPAALGIKNGDVKLIKNAGGQITHPYGSVIFSLLVAVYELGVDTIRNHPLIYKDVEVYGFVMDPHTGAMREVK